MKAVVWTRYGPPEVLELLEVPRPIPKDREVLVKVRAASINSWDWEIFIARYSLSTPKKVKDKYRILGCDVAGVVEAVGRKATYFKAGDEVFGDMSRYGFGGFAEYACANEKAFSLKSRKMPFEEAAAIPQASVLALQGLRKGKIGSGNEILVNGAGGGVGTFAIQLAKRQGADVTAVDKEVKFESMRALGADHVIDYLKEDFIQNGIAYDLIIDVNSKRSIFDYKRALAKGGRCILIGGDSGKIFQALLLGSWLLGSRSAKLLLYHQNRADQDHMRELVDNGTIKPVIDRIFPLERTADAFRHFQSQTFTGKIVIRIA
jgi:NADPH:quinone reductase-like Zn-dependent oxidoreductase